MSADVTASPPARRIGGIRGAEPGPSLVLVAAIHGNEPAGVTAAERVLARLRAAGTTVRGEIAAFVGNARARARGVRYVEHDLNRAWTPSRMETVRGGSVAGGSSEDLEQAELQREIEAVRARARGETILVDLHSTSGDGPPFLVVADTPRSRELAAHFPLTAIVALVEKLPGTLVGALAAEGVASLVLESGQHSRPTAAERAEAFLWIALVRTGAIDAADAPPLEPFLTALARSRGDLPVSMQVAYRHPIAPGDGFRMRPGFRHFQRIAEGDVVADDARGPVAAPLDGYMLMPLYQGLGEDGFFLARGV